MIADIAISSGPVGLNRDIIDSVAIINICNTVKKIVTRLKTENAEKYYNRFYLLFHETLHVNCYELTLFNQMNIYRYFSVDPSKKYFANF